MITGGTRLCYPIIYLQPLSHGQHHVTQHALSPGTQPNKLVYHLTQFPASAGDANVSQRVPLGDPRLPPCLAKPPDPPHTIYSNMAAAAAAPAANMKPPGAAGLETGQKPQLEPDSLAANLQAARDGAGFDPKLYITEQALALQVRLKHSTTQNKHRDKPKVSQSVWYTRYATLHPTAS